MKTEINTKMEDILLDISVRSLSRKYFGKSAAWLYARIDGEDKDNNPVSFTDEELSQLKEALCDLADKIRKTSDSL